MTGIPFLLKIWQVGWVCGAAGGSARPCPGSSLRRRWRRWSFSLVGSLMCDVGLAGGSDLGLDALPLLEKRAAHLEAAAARGHAALHHSAALVILHVSHPTSYACHSTISTSLSPYISISSCVASKTISHPHALAGIIPDRRYPEDPG